MQPANSARFANGLLGVLSNFFQVRIILKSENSNTFKYGFLSKSALDYRNQSVFCIIFLKHYNSSRLSWQILIPTQYICKKNNHEETVSLGNAQFLWIRNFSTRRDVALHEYTAMTSLQFICKNYITQKNSGSRYSGAPLSQLLMYSWKIFVIVGVYIYISWESQISKWQLKPDDFWKKNNLNKFAF